MPGALDRASVRRHGRRAFQSIAFAALLCARPSFGFGGPAADFLLVGTGDADVAGTTIAVSNFEIGANLESVPMPGLTLVEPFPPEAIPVAIAITGDGDLALTHPGGRFNLANLGLWSDLGVRCAASPSSCNDGVSETTWNGMSFPANGLTGGGDFAALRADLELARATIPALPRDVLLRFDGGKWESDLRIALAPGLTVFDIDTEGNDLLLKNRNVVIDGPPGAYAIFRVPRAANFLVSQAALLLGDSGIELGNVLFYTDKPDTNAHFGFSNAVLNGIAFWDLGRAAGQVAFNDVQGCTQVIGDKLNLNDVRLMRCAFALPEPDAALGAAFALASLALLARRSVSPVSRRSRPGPR